MLYSQQFCPIYKNKKVYLKLINLIYKKIVS